MDRQPLASLPVGVSVSCKRSLLDLQRCQYSTVWEFCQGPLTKLAEKGLFCGFLRLLTPIHSFGCNVSLFLISFFGMENHEPTNTQILEAMNAFAHSVDGKFESMDKRFEKIDQRFDKMDNRFERIETTMATKDDLARMEDKLITQIDGFVVLHQTLDVELVSLRARCERMEEFMGRVAKHLNLEYTPT